MFDAICRAEGTVMDRRSYHADAAALRESASMRGEVWKLERSQVFDEAGDPAWEAFLADDWSRVLDIFEGERAAIREEARKYTRLGLQLRRLRIVEHPPTPYLRWEMHSHRIFVECGFDIRVLDAAKIHRFENEFSLPELMVYGNEVIYQVNYDDNWAPNGAKRIDDPVLTRSAAREVSALYAEAEPFMGYFEREIATKTPTPNDA